MRPIAELPTNARACQARVENTVLIKGAEKTAVETTIDCRSCTLFERFQSINSNNAIDTLVAYKTRRFLAPNCGIFASRGIAPQDVTPDLLPPIIIS